MITSKFVYGILFFVAIITGIYFAFAASANNVTITAIVPDNDDVTEAHSAIENEVQVLGFSYGKSDDDEIKEKDDGEKKTKEVEIEYESKENSSGSSRQTSVRGQSLLAPFSVMVYWYRRSNPPPEIDLNRDGHVNIVDFSIFAFNGGISL